MTDSVLKNKKLNTTESSSNNIPIKGESINLLGTYFKIVQWKSFVKDSFATRLLSDQKEKK